MLSPDTFAILAWGIAPSDPDTLRGIRECGFNMALVMPEDVDLAREAGLHCMVESRLSKDEVNLPEDEIDRRVREIVRRAGPSDAIFGYCLYDEPGTDLYPGLTRWVRAFKGAAPDATALINLFPNYASPAQLNAESYQQYIASFSQTVDPGLLCYDHYALMEDGSVAEAAYFQNLESMRGESLRTGVPFWNVVISQGCLGYAEPSPAGMRFQLYTTLAHGARGIVYWRYFTPERGNYRLGPIDPFGNRTPTWDMQRDVNLHARRLGPVVASLKSVNVFHHPEVPEGCSGIASSRYVRSLAGGPFMVGEFEGPEGRPYVMVVNKDLEKSVIADITFALPGDIQLTSAFNGNREPWGGENTWLAPGQGALLCVGNP